MNRKQILLILLSTAFLILLIMVFTPVPAPISKNCFTVSGVVEKVFSPCCQDVNTVLKNDPHQYYINRGLDNEEVDMDYLASILEGKEVNFQVIKRNWTPLDPKHLLMSVAEIERKEQVVFSRMR